MPEAALLAAIRAAGFAADYLPLEKALFAARAWALQEHGVVCIAGSLVLAGEVLRMREQPAKA
jgi:uncharacterized membrane protein YecN with MAPEG domain